MNDASNVTLFQLQYDRIMKEVEFLKLLRHQNIARLYEFHETEKKIYLILEVCPRFVSRP